VALTRHKSGPPSKAAFSPHYAARRGRGLVWVCDVAESSRLLNRNETAAATEEFLQRFFYLSLLAVNSGGGTFVKWTGDGFLAFYETPLDREVGSVADSIFHAAGMLTLLVNSTQLCTKSKHRLRIRHAITYEKDALLIDLEHSGGMKSKDVLGRSVVAAFRLSGISCHYPGIVTHREILRAIDDAEIDRVETFKALKLTEEMRLRYFKGESFGSKDVYVSADRGPRRRKASLKFAQRKAREVLNTIKSGSESRRNPRRYQFSKNFVEGLYAGPAWCGKVMDECYKGFFGPAISALQQFTELSASEVSGTKRVVGADTTGSNSRLPRH
jgi:class 3 adenylate cyclase